MSDIIFGKNPVLEAFSSGVDIEKIFVLATLRGELEIKIRQLCKENQIPLAKVPEVKLNELSRNQLHQGIVAMISPIHYENIEDVVDLSFSTGNVPLVVVIDGVTDVRNIGALSRSAYYFGATALVIAGNFSGRINEETVKSSAGAILKLPVCRVSSLLALISTLQNKGLYVVASALKSNDTLHDVDFNLPCAIILGSEDKGLHYKVLETVDQSVKINAMTDFDSLNVSVAGGIFLYEVNRQRTVNKQ